MYQPGYNLDELELYNHGKVLKIYGEGIVTIKPDTAEIVIGVVTENMQLEIAQKENTKITKQVLDSIKSLGIDTKDIQTKNYNINTKYDYIEGKQVFSGYEVGNYLRISIKDINIVGEIIDAAVKSGANFIGSVNFVISDSFRYYNQALKLAIEDSQNKAMIIASKLKVKIDIVPIRIIEQGKSNAVPMTTMAFKSAESSTPIEAGQNNIVALIESVFIYI